MSVYVGWGSDFEWIAGKRSINAEKKRPFLIVEKTFLSRFQTLSVNHPQKLAAFAPLYSKSFMHNINYTIRGVFGLGIIKK